MAALTLTGLLPAIYEGMDVVSRERYGMVQAVSRDARAERAAKDSYVTSPVVGALAAEDLAIGNVAADYAARTIPTVQIQITKARSVPFGFNGEETLSLKTAGTYSTIVQDTITQAFRTLGNELEADLCSLHKKTSRAYGTATGTPFTTISDFSDFAGAAKILEDNGAPNSDRQMVLASSHITNLRGKQATLFQMDTAGTDDLLRRGIVRQVEGFNIGTSAQIATSVAGTMASATTNNAGYAVGATVLTLATAGTGVAVPGDIVTFAGDTNQYVVSSVSFAGANPASGDTITIAEPGLRVAMSAATKAITVTAATKRSMVFHRSAIQLATRAPAMPEGGDDADDVQLVTDPVTGITYEFAVYRQKRQVRYELNLVWGFEMIAKRHAALLIGA